MKIIIAKNAGFCYGVKRAVEGTKTLIDLEKEPIDCLGELVHNQEVIQSLQKQGVRIIENIEEAKKRTIIRAHGAPKEVYEYAKEHEIQLVDYTCPNVTIIHQIVKEAVQENYYIFIIGNREHPETLATKSFCGENFFIIEKVEDVSEAMESFQLSKNKKILVVSQTTYSVNTFERCIQKIKECCPKEITVTVRNTICNVTEKRQKEAEELSQKSDYMIVIGGKNSSNTQKLYEICKQYCRNTVMIENSRELPTMQFQDDCIVGIVAGASTPQESIQEIVEQLEKN